MLQIDPREEFVAYLDEDIFIQQRYNDYGKSDDHVEQQKAEQKEEKSDQEEAKAADAEEIKAADAEKEQEEDKI